MMSFEKASKVVDMIVGELYNKDGGYAYASFEAMCREYGVTPQDYSDFISSALCLIEKFENDLTNRKDGAY